MNYRQTTTKILALLFAIISFALSFAIISLTFPFLGVGLTIKYLLGSELGVIDQAYVKNLYLPLYAIIATWVIIKTVSYRLCINQISYTKAFCIACIGSFFSQGVEIFLPYFVSTLFSLLLNVSIYDSRIFFVLMVGAICSIETIFCSSVFKYKFKEIAVPVFIGNIAFYAIKAATHVSLGFL